MFELLRKVTLAGIGAVDLTQEKIEVFAKQLVQRGETVEDKTKLIKSVTAKIVEEAEHLKKNIDHLADRVVTRLTQPSNSDRESTAKDHEIATLRAEITDLRARLEKLESQ
ncbi:MAG: hypothetical protein HY709_09600 [Candidatus Latescibacteria bacterium]|nr:hypothetical protein [Candidatus Latescibacterota bacterium]